MGQHCALERKKEKKHFSSNKTRDVLLSGLLNWSLCQESGHNIIAITAVVAAAQTKVSAIKIQNNNFRAKKKEQKFNKVDVIYWSAKKLRETHHEIHMIVSYLDWSTSARAATGRKKREKKKLSLGTSVCCVVRRDPLHISICWIKTAINGANNFWRVNHIARRVDLFLSEPKKI